MIDNSSYVRLWSCYEDSERRLLILLCRNESNKKGKSLAKNISTTCLIDQFPIRSTFELGKFIIDF